MSNFIFDEEQTVLLVAAAAELAWPSAVSLTHTEERKHKAALSLCSALTSVTRGHGYV